MNLFKEIGLMYTKTCPLSCDHCISNSSPSAKGKMALEEAVGYIHTISEMAEAVTFTGGEPLLYCDEIAALIAKARQAGLRTGVITSGAWGATASSIKEKVKLLAESGLDFMLISWDDYHRKYLSPEKPVLVAEAAASLGITVHVRSYFNSSNEGRAAEIFSPFKGLASAHEKNRLTRIGRAVSLPEDHFFWTDALPQGNCRYAMMPLLSEEGCVYACCGPALYSSKGSPLRCGDARQEPLGKILDRIRQDPILSALHDIGPFGLSLMLRDEPANVFFTKRHSYSGMCELCLDITSNQELIASLQSKLQTPEAKRFLAAVRLHGSAKDSWRRSVKNHLTTED